jgi:hypothetical protein
MNSQRFTIWNAAPGIGKRRVIPRVMELGGRGIIRRQRLSGIANCYYRRQPEPIETPPMYAINRSAVLVLPAQPFLNWLHQAERLPCRDLRTNDIFGL